MEQEKVITTNTESNNIEHLKAIISNTKTAIQEAEDVLADYYAAKSRFSKQALYATLVKMISKFTNTSVTTTK